MDRKLRDFIHVANAAAASLIFGTTWHMTPGCYAMHGVCNKGMTAYDFMAFR